MKKNYGSFVLLAAATLLFLILTVTNLFSCSKKPLKSDPVLDEHSAYIMLENGVTDRITELSVSWGFDGEILGSAALRHDDGSKLDKEAAAFRVYDHEIPAGKTFSDLQLSLHVTEEDGDMFNAAGIPVNVTPNKENGFVLKFDDCKYSLWPAEEK